jgi:3-phosphoshikimate 1-carboxyvinyltransferase
MPSDIALKSVTVEPIAEGFSAQIADIAPDKSISHRAAMFALLSDRPSRIRNFLTGEDTLNTLAIVEQLGAQVTHREDGQIEITPPRELQEPDDVLDCGNAGTGMRLFCGLLSGVEGSFVLSGDRYLRSRPMRRVTDPLRRIGAHIDGRQEANLAPLHIRGGNLEAFVYDSPIDSAQVKSALILAALRAGGASRYREKLLSRDHTERMLRGMGAAITTDAEGWIEIAPMTAPLDPLDITVPADPSSGFFFAVAAAIVPGSDVTIRHVTLNPTRIEAYNVLARMGASVTLIEHEDRYEPVGDIRIAYGGKLRAVEVDTRIAWLIDELPALAIAMAAADGVSRVRNAAELRVKESDRIASVLAGLGAAGIETEEYEDGYAIVGGSFRPATIDSFGDHRIAMSFSIAGLLCGMRIEDTACVETSFPNFYTLLNQFTKVHT